MPDGDSFLPRIQSVFYSVFDVRQGPKIVYQVPEGLIAVPSAGPSALTGPPSLPPTPSSETPPPISPAPGPQTVGISSRNSSTSLVSPTDFFRPGRNLPSPQKRSNSSQRTLFNFDDISKYVIPPSALCGRLVTCSTKRHRIIGFPAELKGKYKRNYFRFNLCFVFERGADLSCYEPVVRKVSRVLTSCEEESGFLSSPGTSPAVHAILEQLYEDLNSYSETSIAIDQFNSIELKIFPFYPNPPLVHDWMVPLALINLSKRIEDNWDLTMSKVCKYVDGTNHVARIAHLADCDIALTRQAISHLLYYQVIMTIDIFQYSNMYTLRKSIQWLADEVHVKEECGPYVTKPGKSIPDWPKLLHLYSRLKPGKMVHEWMEEHDVEQLGIDPRRFASFGVIKGFLRRVHRFPVYLPPDTGQTTPNHHMTPSFSTFDASASTLARKRGKSLSGTPLRFPAYSPSDGMPLDGSATFRGRTSSLIGPALSPDLAAVGLSDSPLSSTAAVNISATHRPRKMSAAEKILEQLRSRDIQKFGGSTASSPRTSWIHYQQKDDGTAQNQAVLTTPGGTATNAVYSPATASAVQDSPTRTAGRSESRRQSLIAPSGPPPSPVASKATLNHLTTPSRPRVSRSPSAPHIQQLRGTISTQMQSTHPFPAALVPLLDGDHHTDDIAVRFEAGWPLLEKWLTAIGEGDGNGDYGRVVIIYR
ncbi:nitrogen permease regulator 2-domain-containing protein [Crucibulum laeve]|uniref:Nitrogen permease regulator 2-domain-containing protein n=1 Tax=Crucibulum laeve TaxID=68775 RepID=A0A5C3MBW5_9AGAR|nr:nitrogen permease regulator 2-domain-containing protein [Crucibulum laeve]